MRPKVPARDHNASMGGDIAEWYLTGELGCPFARDQLPDTDVHHTMKSTFIVLGWVSLSFAGSLVSLPFNGREQETVEGSAK